MKNDDLKCWRINYAQSWKKHDNGQGFAMLPLGVIDAIRELCDMVEKLRERNRILEKSKRNLLRKI